MSANKTGVGFWQFLIPLATIFRIRKGSSCAMEPRLSVSLRYLLVFAVYEAICTVVC
ncbi:MAG: hypothetical protein AAF441_05040 [Pseudomonadota bacterium]